MTQTTRQMPVLRTPRPGLCTCGQPGPGAWEPLARAGVRTVVNLRPDDEIADRNEAEEVRSAGLAYVHIPVRDADDLTREAAQTLQQVLHSSPASVLVHCGSANRAGALIALGDAWFGSRNIENALALGRDAGMTALEPTVRILLAEGGTRR
jgi:uncharacterized protein (TIGR01244 family)